MPPGDQKWSCGLDISTTSSSYGMAVSDFMSGLNNNDRGIRFNFEASLEEINFLDLKIKISGDRFVTSTFF